MSITFGQLEHTGPITPDGFALLMLDLAGHVTATYHKRPAPTQTHCIVWWGGIGTNDQALKAFLTSDRGCALLERVHAGRVHSSKYPQLTADGQLAYAEIQSHIVPALRSVGPTKRPITFGSLTRVHREYQTVLALDEYGRVTVAYESTSTPSSNRAVRFALSALIDDRALATYITSKASQLLLERIHLGHTLPCAATRYESRLTPDAEDAYSDLACGLAHVRCCKAVDRDSDAFTLCTEGHVLSRLAHKMYSIAESKGFHDAPVSLAVACANIHGEVSELWEAFRRNQLGEPCDKAEGMTAAGLKPLTCLEEELADILIRVLDSAAEYKVNIDQAVVSKAMYNAQRERMNGGKIA